MHHQSKIIVSQNTNIEYLLSLINADMYSEVEIIKTDESSIGIKEVGSIAEKASKKSDYLKVFLIIESEKLTNEAQNSLLKIVEEPPVNVLVVLQTSNPDLILETIKSRCLIIIGDKLSDDEEFTNIEFVFKNFIELEYSEKIKVVEKFLKDEHNKSSIKKAILVILNEIAKKRVNVSQIKKLEKAYKAIDYNVSPKLIFDYIILNLK